MQGFVFGRPNRLEVQGSGTGRRPLLNWEARFLPRLQPVLVNPDVLIGVAVGQQKTAGGAARSADVVRILGTPALIQNDRSVLGQSFELLFEIAEWDANGARNPFLLELRGRPHIHKQGFRSVQKILVRLLRIDHDRLLLLRFFLAARTERAAAGGEDAGGRAAEGVSSAWCQGGR